MRDGVTFETRLADAFERYAELSPAMDDESIARRAIADGRSGRASGWLAALRGGALDSSPAGRPKVRIAYLLLVLGLLLAAILVALATGTFRTDPLRPSARNGSIAFTVQGNNHGAAGTHLIEADGSSDRPIEAGRCPAYSRDGSVLAFVSYEGSAYLVVQGVASEPTRKVLLVEDAPTSVSYALSPDGSQVAWVKPATSGSELWTAPTAAGRGTRIVPALTALNETYSSPLWSPDGTRIAFGTYVRDPVTGDSRRTALSVVGANGSDRRLLTARAGRLDTGMSWSPDGLFLAYTGVPDGLPVASGASDASPTAFPPLDVFVIGTDGAGDRDVTRTPASESDPEWSPDGDVLGFDASVDGEAHRLTTIHMNGPTPVGVAALGPESEWFVWSPDGTHLLWVELETPQPETYRSTLHAIDRDFREAPTTVRIVDGQIVCPPSWQRLEP